MKWFLGNLVHFPDLLLGRLPQRKDSVPGQVSGNRVTQDSLLVHIVEISCDQRDLVLRLEFSFELWMRLDLLLAKGCPLI